MMYENFLLFHAHLKCAIAHNGAHDLLVKPHGFPSQMRMLYKITYAPQSNAYSKVLIGPTLLVVL